MRVMKSDNMTPFEATNDKTDKRGERKIKRIALNLS